MYKLNFIYSPNGFSRVQVTRSLVLCVCFVDRCLFFVIFLLAIMLSVLLRYTHSNNPFGIFKLILKIFVNLTYIEQTPVYSSYNCWSQGGSV